MRARICRMICSTSTESDRTVKSAIRNSFQAHGPWPQAQLKEDLLRSVPDLGLRPWALGLRHCSRASPAAAELGCFLQTRREDPERAAERAQAGLVDRRAFFRNHGITAAVGRHVFPVPEQPAPRTREHF